MKVRTRLSRKETEDSEAGSEGGSGSPDPAPPAREPGPATSSGSERVSREALKDMDPAKVAEMFEAGELSHLTEV